MAALSRVTLASAGLSDETPDKLMFLQSIKAETDEIGDLVFLDIPK